MFANCLKKLTQRSLTAVSYEIFSEKTEEYKEKIPNRLRKEVELKMGSESAAGVWTPDEEILQRQRSYGVNPQR